MTVLNLAKGVNDDGGSSIWKRFTSFLNPGMGVDGASETQRQGQEYAFLHGVPFHKPQMPRTPIFKSVLTRCTPPPAAIPGGRLRKDFYRIRLLLTSSHLTRDNQLTVV